MTDNKSFKIIIENINPINPIIKNIFLDAELIFLLSIKIHIEPTIVKINNSKSSGNKVLITCKISEEELIFGDGYKRYISDNTSKIIPNANIIFFFNIILFTSELLPTTNYRFYENQKCNHNPSSNDICW